MEYRMVKTGMWQDPFFEELSSAGKLLFVYLITSADNLGIVCASKKRISFETQIEKDEIEKALQVFEENKKIVRDNDSVYLCNFIRNQCKLNPSIVVCRQRELLEVKSEVIRDAILTDYPQFYKRIDTAPTGCRQGVGTVSSQERREEESKEEESIGEERKGKKTYIVDETSTLSSASTPKPETPTCPHQEIIALYHEILPEMPQVKTWNESRRQMLQKRWREDKNRQNLEWWRSFFELVKASDFLCGRKKPTNFNLEWLIRPQNFVNIIEGKYSNYDNSSHTHVTPSYEEMMKQVNGRFNFLQ